MAESILGGVITFFQQIGVYDIVLPFLLTFAIMFAILEKTKVLGVDKIDGRDYTKKSLNSIVAFVVAFLVIASSEIVATITAISSQMMIVVVLIIFFLLSIGIFYKKDEDVSLEKRSGTRTFFMYFVGISIFAIFLNAMKSTIDGEIHTWLEIAVGFLLQSTTDTAVAAIVLLIGVILFMWFIVKEPKSKKSDEGSSS